MPIAENLCVCVSKKTPDSFWSQFFVVLIWKVFAISSPTTWMARKWRYDFHGTGKSPFFIVDFGGSEIFPGSERRQLTHQDRRRRSRVQRPLPGQKTSEKRRQNWGRSRMIILWSSYDHPKHPMYQTSLITKIPKSHPRPHPSVFALRNFEQKAWYQVLAPCASIKRCNPIQSAAPQGHGRFEVHSHIIHGILAELGWFVKCCDSCLLQDFGSS